MHIKSFSVANHKSIAEPVHGQLESGINVIVGRNNCGKTALLEALSLDFGPKAHRSLATTGVDLGALGTVHVEVALSSDEFIAFLAAHPLESEAGILMPELRSQFSTRIGYWDDSTHSADVFRDWILDQPITITLGCSSAKLEGASLTIGDYTVPAAGVTGHSGWRLRSFAENSHDSAPCTGFDPNQFVARRLSGRFRFFPAFRLSAPNSEIGNSPELDKHVQNLVEVLDLLQRNPTRYARFLSLLREVLPEVAHVSVEMTQKHFAEIAIWPIDQATERVDMTIPLADCGTGVAQIAAFAYALLSKEPHIMLIDEPQAFLHPGAIRKLLSIAGSFEQHQLIIATHSTAVVAAPETRRILVVTCEHGKSALRQIERRDIEQQRRLLAELGTSINDVFGVDTLLWVEGPTEEISFRLIAEALRPELMRSGAAIKALVNTGDFDGRDADRVLEIYERLATAGAVVPPNVRFLLDDENRPEQKKRELIRRSGGRLAFLPRRMYENYLLNPAAVAARLNALDTGREQPLSEQEVRNWFDEHFADAKYEAAQADGGIVLIHAGKFLYDVFRDLTQSRVSYRKPEHSVALTEWLLQNSPGDLEEIAALLERALGPNAENEAAVARAAGAGIDA